MAVLLVLAGACAPLREFIGPGVPRAEALARTVTIARDEWGVPTVTGPTDAAVAFGIAWAQAEDDLWQIEEDYIHALGRAANYWGERYLAHDLVRAAFEVERLAREEYAREPPERRAVWDAFVAGLNFYMAANRVQPRLLARFEPWMPFALARVVGAGTVIDGVLLGQAAPAAAPSDAPVLVGAWAPEHAARGEPPAAAMAGSIAWAVAPARSADGHALLLHAAYGTFLGTGQLYEMNVRSDAGWQARGFAVLGTPVIRSGHTSDVAWAHTGSTADFADVFEVVFDHATDPLLYRWDGGWRRAEVWRDTLLVNTEHGVVPRVYGFLRTHHGPVVAQRDGRMLAVRIARMHDGGALQQWHAMNHAQTGEQFRAALALAALPGVATMYADRAGTIAFFGGSAVPVRDGAMDWSQPVDGTTSGTEWRGYHGIGELPQLVNPSGGWIASTGGAPMTAAGGAAQATHPPYMGAAAGAAVDPRALVARTLLEDERAWTPDALAAVAFDTRVAAGDDVFDGLVHEWERLGGFFPQRALRVDPALDALRAWDRRATAESPEMTLFVLWQERLRSGEYTGEFRHFHALEDVVERLERDWGRARVAWGEVNRLQRVQSSRSEAFSDDRPSVPVAGAPAWTGTLFTFVAPPAGAQRGRYGVAGTRAVNVVQLGPEVRSRAVAPFGQSANPNSPHWFDQAALYAAGRLRAAPFSAAEVAATARVTYNPIPEHLVRR